MSRHAGLRAMTLATLGLIVPTLAVSAVVTRGPYLQSGSTSRITIRWRTDVPTDSRVTCGPAPGSSALVVTDTSQTTEHIVPVVGLTAATRYFYTVGSTSGALAGGDSSHSFVTPPPTGSSAPIRAWIIGDSGQPGVGQSRVRDSFKTWTGARDADLWLMLGDNAYNTGTDSQFQAAVFDAYPEMLRKAVLWPTRGNHEVLHVGLNNDYYDIFSLPTLGETGGVPSTTEAYYSFDHGNVHFICLDSEGSVRTPGGAMAVWLRADLAATSQPWIVAFWHHPPYTKGSHDSDDSLDSGGRMRDMRRYILPILDSTGVDVVFTGHSHSYERSYLLNGHYDVSSTLTSAMKVDSTSGRVDGTDGPYEKPLSNPPYEGTVHAVAGSSSRLGGGTLNHPVMVSSWNIFGSVALDIHGGRLDARFLDTLGVVRDSFTIVKVGMADVDRPVAVHRLQISVNGPNPFVAGTSLEYVLPAPGRARVSVYSADGRLVRRLVDREHAAGTHLTGWDGLDRHGRAVGNGVYFAVVDREGESKTVRLARLR
jgi:hypothetical protein